MVFRPAEGLKNPLNIILAHAHAIILEHELIAAAARPVAGLLRHRQLQHAPVRCILHAVAHQVGKHLLQPQAVTQHVPVFQLLHLQLQCMAAGLNLGIHHGHQALHQLCQIKRLILQLHLAGLNLAHLQHLIDKVQKVLACHADLPQAVQHPLPVIHMAGGNSRHADDAVHGGADIVGHIGQKHRLGTIGAAGFLYRLIQPLLLSNLQLLFLIDILERHRKLIFLVIRLHQQALQIPYPAISQHTVVDIVHLLAEKNPLDLADRADIIKEALILIQHILAHIPPDIVLIIAFDIHIIIKLVHGLAHAIAGAKPRIHADTIHCLVGHGQGADELSLLVHAAPVQLVKRFQIVQIPHNGVFPFCRSSPTGIYPSKL